MATRENPALRKKYSDMITQVLDRFPTPGDSKRIFMLKQIVMKANKDLGIPTANGLILQHDLDQTDKIKLFKIQLTPNHIR